MLVLRSLITISILNMFMSFLMGLNDSVAQVIRQLLLMDLMSSISKVFSFISQEERQRSISIHINFEANNSLAFVAKGESQTICLKGMKLLLPKVTRTLRKKDRYVHIETYMDIRLIVINFMNIPQGLN